MTKLKKEKSTTFQKVQKWASLILLLLSIASILFGWYEKREKDRYKDNYSLSVSSEKTYKDKNGILVKEVETLQLTKEDLKRSNDSTIKKLLVELDASNLKLRKTTGMTYIDMKTNNNFNTKIKYDTILTFYDSLRHVLDTVVVQKMTYKDNWIDFNCLLPLNKKDSAQISITTYHSLFITNSWYREGNWKIRNLIFWRRKHFKCDVKDVSPYSHITDIKSISVGRKNP